MVVDRETVESDDAALAQACALPGSAEDRLVRDDAIRQAHSDARDTGGRAPLAGADEALCRPGASPAPHYDPKAPIIPESDTGVCVCC